MRVVADGTSYDLGSTETTPTIGITDYSRRETDDFGVTTVVKRGFSRSMSMRMAVPFEQVDTLQRRLAGLRATTATWIANEAIRSLQVTGFFKDFDLDLNTPPTSFCTLTVEGLVETDVPEDGGANPSVDGLTSTLQLLQPITISDATLVSTSVAEDDHPEWSSTASYPAGSRTIKGATHRVYESIVANNLGNDPSGSSGKWLDVGPTNRWAMFDQAIGTATTAAASISATVSGASINAVALLDVVATSVRVQAIGYDRTIGVTAGAVEFLDLPITSQPITVTVSGVGDVSVGTLLPGRLVALGSTGSSPTAGITDYSRKDVDEFGEVTLVQRGYAKRMTAVALLRTDAVDDVASRITAVRGVPALWIGQAGLESLTIFGFFKDWSIEIDESTSKLSLSIEGLSAAPPTTGGLTIPWTQVLGGDPAHPKPADGATNSADPDSPLGPDRTVAEALAIIDEGQADIADAQGRLTGLDALGLQLSANVRQTIASALKSQLIADADRLRAEAATTLAGQKVALVLKQEVTNRQIGDAVIQEQINLLGVVAEDGSAFVLDLDRVLVSPTQTFAGRLTQLTAELQSDIDTKASVAQLNEAVANASGASSTALQQVVAELDAQIDTKASVTDLQQAKVDQSQALSQAIGQLSTSFGSALGVKADITYVDQAVANVSGSSATSYAELAARLRQGSPNLLLNGDFADGFQSWTVIGPWGAYHDKGTYAAIQPSDDNQVIYQDTQLGNFDQILSLSGEGQSDVANGLRAWLQWLDGNKIYLSDGANIYPADWQRAAASAAVRPANAVYARVLVIGQVHGQWARVTRLQLQSGEATDWRNDASQGAVQASVTQLKSAVATESETRAQLGTTLQADYNNKLAGKASNQQLSDAIAGEVEARASDYQALSGSIGTQSGRIDSLREVVVNTAGGVQAKALLQLDANGHIVGIYLSNNGQTGSAVFLFESLTWLRPDGSPMISNNGGTLRLYNVEIDRLKVNTAVAPVRVSATNYITGQWSSNTGFPDPRRSMLTAMIYMTAPGWIEASAKSSMGFYASGVWSASIAVNGSDMTESLVGGTTQTSLTTQGAVYVGGAGWYTVELKAEGGSNMDFRERSLFVKGFPNTAG